VFHTGPLEKHAGIGEGAAQSQLFGKVSGLPMLYFLRTFFGSGAPSECIYMWRRLFMLALCAMSALRADVCDGLPAGPPTGRAAAPLFESNEPLSFKLSVKSGGPAFRMTVRPLWQIQGGISRDPVDETRAGEIEVARCKDGKQLQVLPIAAEQPMNFGSTFHADDINFDGYLDFSVVCEFAASGAPHTQTRVHA
jgi:hypothetical protein